MASPTVVVVLTVLVFCLPIHIFISLLRNLHEVRSVPSLRHLPRVVAPIPVSHPAWIVVDPWLSPLIVRLLPRRWLMWMRTNTLSWPYREGRSIPDDVWAQWRQGKMGHSNADSKEAEKWAEHEKYMNGTFVNVQPDRWYISLCDDLTVVELLKRKDVWLKPGKLYDFLSIFGPNVVSLNGKPWARHRKITAPCFNERLSALVWAESTRQARSMLAHWETTAAASPSPNGDGNDMLIDNVCDDTRALALHVLSHAGFGIRQEGFATGGGGADVVPRGHAMSHQEALWTVMTNMFAVFTIASVPEWVCRPLKEGRWRMMVPRGVRKIVTAMGELETYMRETIEGMRRKLSRRERGGGGGAGGVNEMPNLMAALIRSSEEYGRGGGGSAGLADEEIMGNVFIFNLAGHDTTANTLSFALAVLALDQEVQDWVREELRRVLSDGVDHEWEYTQVFRKLVRCQAVMHETLRMYGPVVAFLRHSSEETDIPLSTGASLIVPANTEVLLNMHAVHTSAAWSSSGYPARTFAPQRWIKLDPKIGHESLEQPEGTTFIPWTAGPRVCLGIRFSQVEFVAALSTVFRKHRLRPALRKEQAGAATSKKEEEKLAEETVRHALRNAGTEGTTRSMRKRDMPLLKLEKLKG